jgi:1-deoxy-D-xylulose-5-phosphate reductoisomerase
LLSIIGSTGSIGRQAIEVARHLGLEVAALAAKRDVKLIEQQARLVKPRVVALADESAARALKTALADTNIHVLSGTTGVNEAAQAGATLIAAASGIAGLAPVLAGIASGSRIALANKEALVAAGKLVMSSKADIIPVDSEHSAIFQCIQTSVTASSQLKLILTGSGGPYRGATPEELENATLEQTLKHPKWNMGSKITVDSATLMNKGLEFIEAMRLFNVAPSQIRVVIHPECVIHSAVEFPDGATIAQLGKADMRVPISYAITYPRRFRGLSEPFDFFSSNLTFEQPDRKTFHCLALAELCAEHDYANGTNECCVLNAANEAAVQAYLNNKLSFTRIPCIIEEALEKFSGVRADSYHEIIVLDETVRSFICI